MLMDGEDAVLTRKQTLHQTILCKTKIEKDAQIEYSIKNMKTEEISRLYTKEELIKRETAR